MAKYLKIAVTRMESTDVYIEVPDDFDKSKIDAKIVEQIADDTTDSMDWQREDGVEIQSVREVSEEKATEYCVGTWPE